MDIGQVTTAVRTRLDQFRKRMTRQTLGHLWREHGLALLAYLLLSVALTWPLMRSFRSAITGVGDARHYIWMLWHTKQFVLAREPLFYTSLLYYPYGTTLLVNSLGPLMGFAALPLWLIGPEAVYNGMMLAGFALTGYCMYLLARSLGFNRGVAFFAGTVLLAAPIHLAALFGHLHKAFLGLLPLVLLSLRHTLDPNRSRWWAAVTAFLLSLTILLTAEQFIYAVIGMGLFLLLAWLGVDGKRRKVMLRRGILLAGCMLLLNGPFLIAIAVVSNDPQIAVDTNLEAFQNQPDLAHFFVPAYFSRFLGPAFADLLREAAPSSVEKAVSLSWTGLVLCLLALFSGKPARRWLLFILFSVLIALGPTLKVLGVDHFTEFDLPIMMPFALITALPGLSFWRTPGRFMFVGLIAFGIAASYGLAWLQRRLPGRWLGHLAVLVATALLLFESWPQPWPQERLPVVPQFYQEIAQDGEQYGVLDLPIRPFQEVGYSSWHIYFSSYYEMHQLVHGKGIAVGYTSRNYHYHPLFAHFISDSIASSPLQSDVLVDDSPANRYANAGYELARYGYRYVVFHKPQEWYREYQWPDSWGELVAREFIAEVFGDRAPIVEDELVEVYEIGPVPDVADLTTTIALRESTWQNWVEMQTGERWALSPSTFYLASPQSELAYLEVTPSVLQDAESGAYADGGLLTLEWSGGMSATAAMTVGGTTVVPLLLSAGSEVITLTVRDADGGATGEPRLLDFPIRTVNLRTTGHAFPPPDVWVNGQPQDGRRQLVAIQGEGWYNEDAPAWRWAMSPSELMVYSPTPQAVQIEMTLSALHDPASPDGLGAEGILLATANGGAAQRFAVRVGEPVSVEFQLGAGWNRITLTLESGNFRPSEAQPGNGDQRLLSFALARLDIRTQ